MQWKKCLITAVLGLFSLAAVAAPMHKVYLDPGSPFSSFFASALQKKKVPVTVTVDPTRAEYSITFQINNDNGSVIEGITRAMNNGGLYNAGASGQVTMSIMDIKSKDIVFTYTCRKSSRYNGDSPSTTASVAECLAKHWKNSLEK
jgi:hypothetical protein